MAGSEMAQTQDNDQTRDASSTLAGWLGIRRNQPDVGALSRDQVRQLHQRAKNKMAEQVKTAAPDAGPVMRMALRSYLTKARKARHKVANSELAQLAKDGLWAIRREMNDFETRFFNILDHSMFAVASLFRRARPGWSERLFKDGQDRVFIPFDPSLAGPSDTERRVTSLLIRKGYKDIDYKSGYCMDEAGKNKLKIGRILKKADDHLYNQFTRDGSRGDNERFIVISRRPMDVARMSTGRGWESCMTKGGLYYHYVPLEIANNSIVAYLVSKNDPDIEDPQARVMVRPYRKWGGLSTMLHAGPSYGLNVPGFRLQVQEVLDKTINLDKRGVFSLSLMSYDDNQPRKLVRFGPETRPERVLRALGVRYTRRSGQIIAHGSIDLSNMGLEQLPNLSNVVVEGSFNCNGNRLKNLRGSPAEIRGGGYYAGSFNAANNRLESAEGMTTRLPDNAAIDLSHNKLTRLPQLPQTVGSFNADNNHLVSLEGGPRRATNTYSVRNNDLRDTSGFPEQVGWGFRYDGNPVLEAAIEAKKRAEEEARAKAAAEGKKPQTEEGLRMPEMTGIPGAPRRNPVRRAMDRIGGWLGM